MQGRGIGLVLGLTGLIVAGTVGAQTVSTSASSSVSSSSVAAKPKPAVTKPAVVKPIASIAVKPVTATGTAKLAAGTATGAVKSGVTPATTAAKPAITSGAYASSAASSSSAAAPRPRPIPAQPKTVPAECLTINTTPFGGLESLLVTGPTHAPVHFDVEIASAPAQRGQGLMCRRKLPADQGMLFEFPRASEQIFWMHDTVLPLDILYIAPDGHVVSITKVAYPLSERKLPSHGRANGVLEINAGLVDKLGLKPGDQVVYPFFVPSVAPVAVSASASASSGSASSGLAQ